MISILAMMRAGLMRAQKLTRTAPEILEIRVHGVQNTPPAEMLEIEPENVRRGIGDELGSFWYRADNKPEGRIHSIEAFSWGAQARTGGGSALAATGRAIVHVGWFLLLPYALANLAYWTRRIGEQKTAGSKSWDGAPGAATVRIFGLLLTLIAVAAFSSVAIDLVAIQCFRDGTKVCAALPEVFDGLRVLDRDSRAALLGIVPIATVLVLYAIGRSGRVHFEERLKTFGEGLGSEGQGSEGQGDTEVEEGRPLLATRGFWAVSRVGQTTEWLHVAASVTLVLILLALDSAYADDVNGCFREATSTITWDCIVEGWNHQLAAWFAIGGLILMIAIVLLIVLASHTPIETNRLGKWFVGKSHARSRKRGEVETSSGELRTVWKRGAAMVCLVLAIAGYVAWAILAFTPTTSSEKDGPGFMGLIVTPIVLVVLAIFLALAGIGWRALRNQMAWRWVSGILLSLGAAALLFSHVELPLVVDLLRDLGVPEENVQWLFVAAAVAFIGLHLLVAWATSGNNSNEAWRGQGPAVAMILALFTSMALSSLLVLGAASWLGRPVDAAPESEIFRTPGAPLPDEIWNTPDAYERFAVVLTVIAVLMIVLIIVAVAANLTRFIVFSLPNLMPDDDYTDPAGVGGILTPEVKYPSRLAYPQGQLRRRAVVRRSSHMLHRGEPLFGWLAVVAGVGFLSLASTTVFTEAKLFVSGIGRAMKVDTLTTDIRLASTAVLVAVALAAVAAVATQATTSGDRPLGVFWDVVAFFPRAGHPFAPPCFGERVVPELSARTTAWMNGGGPTKPRAVIFTAHSMGSTICAATLFALRGEKIATGPLKDGEITSHIALLSYGTQLRAYFSRFFPSVFGPGVLGVPGVRAPSLWYGDPWRRQVRDEFRPEDDSRRKWEEHWKQKEETRRQKEQERRKRREERSTKGPLDREDDQQGAAGDALTLTAILGAMSTEGAAGAASARPATDSKPAAVPRWRSLWRRTDYLGFPVYGYRGDGNPIDEGATESAPKTYLWRIATHSDYLGTEQFLRARDELVDELRRSRD
ncbi:hypothetical protein LQ757_12625 [Agromyces sp. SYSU K20354]|uniref:hypothetical protein n=1 Tax=Agromyces cavernae TaxID=2898659 RepID=UPI001E532DFC|nr:hypothetical protein [Agromyces cavernae]MCD2443120.1 hypothetical protein [Agromyces cavernae]